MAQLTFHGAAETVTGSKYLLEADGAKVLIDCGLFQGVKRLRQLNWKPLEFDPAELDCVILTHAHLDHVGYLPKLVREGFKGPIYCTPATEDLAELILMDEHLTAAVRKDVEHVITNANVLLETLDSNLNFSREETEAQPAGDESA